MTFFVQAFVHPSCDTLTTTTSNQRQRQRQLQIKKRRLDSTATTTTTTTAFMSNSLFEQPSADYSFLDGTSIDHPLLLAATSTTTTTTATHFGESAVTSFEPILNVPALVTFLFITTIFTALILRTNQVEDAVRLRKQRLEELRILKTKEISNDVGSSIVSSEDVQESLHLYEDAVQREESLRQIVPGVRIVPPSSNDRKEEEASLIAKQLLGKDYNIGREQRVDEYDDEEQQRKNNGKLPNVAIGILLMVGLSQVGLLAFLNFGFAADANNSLFNKL